MKNLVFFILAVLFANEQTFAQNNKEWNNKSCAVVLTYDDSIDGHLDIVAPALDSFKFKGTFYVIGASASVAKRTDEWRAVAKKGHELGNHTLNHPCDGSLGGRNFVNADKDLNKYTLNRAVNEIRLNNTLLKAIDGKSKRTFAYPCGDKTVEGANFYKEVQDEFSGARGVSAGLENAAKTDLSNIKTYSINGKSAAYMIDIVKEAQRTKSLVVFLFHGVGGGHSLNVDLNAHRELLQYLKANEKEIWVAPMVDVAEHIKKKQALN
ncbi:MAG: chitooligosaccharide deacetylase [Pedobacter sp.]|nr:MAG: chitooligosaccharide deacetylase [Pedobacter sp.]